MQAEAAVTGGKSSERLELIEPQNHLFTLTIALNQGTMEKAILHSKTTIVQGRREGQIKPVASERPLGRCPPRDCMG